MKQVPCNKGKERVDEQDVSAPEPTREPAQAVGACKHAKRLGSKSFVVLVCDQVFECVSDACVQLYSRQRLKCHVQGGKEGVCV